jgi:hypothetical protein
MLDTVLDISGGSAWRLLGESLALVRSGLRARTGVATGGGTRRLAADVCAQGATVWGLVLLIALLRFDRLLIDSPPNGFFEHETAFVLFQVLLACSIAAALVGYDRLAAAFGFAWVGTELWMFLAEERVPGRGSAAWTAHWIALVAVPLACYVVMLLMPRTRPRKAQRLLWLVVALLVGLVLPPAAIGLGTRLGSGLGLEGEVLLVLLLAGLFLTPAGPRLPLAFAIALVAYGLSRWTRPEGFVANELYDLRWALTTVGPVLLATGAALRFVSARRGLAR